MKTQDFWAGLPLGPGVRLLARDENGLAALDKPAGVLSHPNRAGEEPRSLLVAPYRLDGEVYEWEGPEGPLRLWLLNRLDSATSGVILVASGPELAREVKEQFRKRQMSKAYAAAVFGAPVRPEEAWRDRLEIVKRGGIVRSAPGGAVAAECLMKLVRRGNGLPRISLLRLEPGTGRSHQLRVQCAKRGLPIVGDQTYGDFRANRAFAKQAGTKRLFLHSLESSLDYAFRGRTYAFSARSALPAEFEAAVGPGGQTR